jgi:hypothetical protein
MLQILTAAYQVEITIRAGTSIVKILIEKMKQASVRRIFDHSPHGLIFAACACHALEISSPD